MTICLDHLLHAAQIKSDATYLIEPISTTTTNNTDIINEEYQSNLNELSNSLFILNELNDLSPSSSPQLARSILQIILMDINKSDDILAHFEVISFTIVVFFSFLSVIFNLELVRYMYPIQVTERHIPDLWWGGSENIKHQLQRIQVLEEEKETMYLRYCKRFLITLHKVSNH